METQQPIINKYSKYDIMTPTELVRAMAEVQKLKEAKDEELKAINAEFDFLRLIKIPNTFEAHEIKNMSLDGVGRCQLTSDMHASIAADQKEAAYQYFRDLGKGSLITESINPSTLKATLKSMLKAGEEIPTDIFKVSPFTRASITKV